MISANRIQLACQHVRPYTVSSLCWSYRPSLPISRGTSSSASQSASVSHVAASRPLGARSMVTNRFAQSDSTTSTGVAQDENTQSLDRLSPFKKQRMEELQADRDSEDPLFPDTYPRLGRKFAAERVSPQDFYNEFDNFEPGKLLTLMGRVRSKQVLGSGLIFIRISSEFTTVQIMLSKKSMVQVNDGRKFSLFRHLIQVGDHISVTGHIPTTVKPGQMPTLQAVELPELICPAMEQIPEKLIDSKTKMEARHVDMLVNREVVDVLRLRSEITKYMRDHLHSKRFLEFQTPILAENAGGAVARPFTTRATGFGDKDLAMRIAPELWLKRLVIGGVDRVFEIGPAFRNEGIDATHNPEFTICEFYSAYSNLPDLINETEEIMCGLAKHTQQVIANQLTSLPPIDMERFAKPFRQIEFVPGLEKAMGIRLPKLSTENALPELIAILKMSGISIPGEVPSTLAKLLDRLAAIYLEPESMTQPVFITNHPACMSPLSKSFLCPKTYQLVSARAELFFGGRELANMYEEENNPEEQKRKLMAHRHLVNKRNGEIAIEGPEGDHISRPASEDDEECNPLDNSFVKALDYGLPPTGGWGCGVERLVMLFSGANRISDCLSFGTLKNVVGLSADDSKKAESSSTSGEGEQLGEIELVPQEVTSDNGDQLKRDRS